jgi:hypothetical protein
MKILPRAKPIKSHKSNYILWGMTGLLVIVVGGTVAGTATIEIQKWNIRTAIREQQAEEKRAEEAREEIRKQVEAEKQIRLKKENDKYLAEEKKKERLQRWLGQFPKSAQDAELKKKFPGMSEEQRQEILAEQRMATARTGR